MNTTKTLIILAVVIVLGGGALFLMNNSSSEDAMMEKDESAMTEAERMEQEKMEKEAMMKDEGVPAPSGVEGMMEKPGDAMMAKGSYESYAPEKVAKANEGDVVLFFRASWCPTCRALDADIKANLGAIPHPFGFKVSALPIKISGGSAGWVRPVAIVHD